MRNKKRGAVVWQRCARSLAYTPGLMVCALVCALRSALVCLFRGLFACVMSWVEIFNETYSLDLLYNMSM